MGRRVSNVLAVAISIGLVLGVLWLLVSPLWRHDEFCRATRAEFESLAKKRPPTVTRKQWHKVVAWTLNAHANCITYAIDLPQVDRDKFLAELRERVRAPVELTAIDWIWDELVRLTSAGQTYSDRWRPTTPQRLREFEEGDYGLEGIEVD